jgi:hypothetical protein
MESKGKHRFQKKMKERPSARSILPVQKLSQGASFLRDAQSPLRFELGLRYSRHEIHGRTITQRFSIDATTEGTEDAEEE